MTDFLFSMKTSILLICCVALFLVRISAASLSISVKPRNKISLKCKNVDKKNCNDKRSLSVLTSIRGGTCNSMIKTTSTFIVIFYIQCNV